MKVTGLAVVQEDGWRNIAITLKIPVLPRFGDGFHFLEGPVLGDV
jgi:hypothetical protein